MVAVLTLGLGGRAGADAPDPAYDSAAHELTRSLRPATRTLAERLRRQLVRLEAEAETVRATRRAEQRVAEAELSLRGTRRDLEHHLRLELAEDAKDELVLDLELRDAARELRGSAPRRKLERLLYRLDLRRSIRRVLRTVELERRGRELERTVSRREARDLGLPRSTPGVRRFP